MVADLALLVGNKIDAALRAQTDHFLWIEHDAQKASFDIVKNVLMFLQRFERDTAGFDPLRTETADNQIPPREPVERQARRV